MTNRRFPLVRFEDVALGYGRERVLESLSFTLFEGDFLGLVGPNGAGKSTILKALLGILGPRRGRIVYGKTLHEGLALGYVPQRHTVDEIFPLTVREIVGMARYREAGVLRGLGRDAREAVDHALVALGIENLAGRRFGALSGGQRQRALIARALATGANCLVLDEPTDGMDLASQHAILELIAGLHRDEGITVLFVSHLLNEVANYVDRLAILEGGRLTVGPIDDVLTAERLTALYGIEVRVGSVDGARVVLPAKEAGAP